MLLPYDFRGRRRIWRIGTWAFEVCRVGRLNDVYPYESTSKMFDSGALERALFRAWLCLSNEKCREMRIGTLHTRVRGAFTPERLSEMLLSSCLDPEPKIGEHGFICSTG